jgi:hypothetical protein
MDEFDTVLDLQQPEFQGQPEVDCDKGFPSFRYGPDGQSGVFQSAKDVPTGWKDHPSKVPGAPDPSKLEAEPKRPSRAEMIKYLKGQEVEFKANLGGAQLADLVKEAKAKEIRREKMAEVRSARKPKAKKRAKAKK